MEKILQQQVETLKNVESLTRVNNLIQLAQLYEQKSIDDDSNQNHEDLLAVNKTLIDGLLAKSGEGVNSNIIKVYKELQKLNASSTPGKQTKVEVPTKGIEKAIISSYKTINERLNDSLKSQGMTPEKSRSPKEVWDVPEGTQRVSITEEEYNVLRKQHLDAREKIKNDPNATMQEKMGFSDEKRFGGKTHIVFDPGKTMMDDYKKWEMLLSSAEFNLPKIERSLAGSGIGTYGNEFHKYVEPEAGKPTAKPVTNAQDLTENQIENNRNQEDQKELLEKIEKNTNPNTPARLTSQSAEVGDGGGGGIFGGIGMKLASIGTSIKKGIGDSPATTLLALAGALWVTSKALENFIKIEWNDVFKGLTAISGLALVGKLVGDNAGSMLKGALAITALGASLAISAFAFKEFASIEWETLGKAGIAIAALAGGAALIGAFAVPIAIGAGVIGLLGLSLLPFAAAIDIAAPAMEQFVGAMKQLNDVNGDNLFKVGGGLAAIAAGMVAFGTANAVGGVTNLVGGFLSAVSGQKTPVEQILELGKSGEGVEKAGIGVEKLANGLGAFSKIDTDKIKAIAALPTEKIAAMGLAMSSAGEVYGKSSENASAAVKGGSKGGSTNVVSAPTTNINKTTNMIKSPIRNQESSISKYIESKYAH